MKKTQLLQSFSGGGGSGGSHKKWTAEIRAKEEEGSPPPSIKLRLGIGDGDGDSDSLTHHQQDSKRVDDVAVFTPTQLNELQLHSLIFKHIAARLPVPLHLVVPVWNSVVSSLGPANGGGIYKLYPSFVGWSPECFDYRNMVDPDPERCRRTDGKKWRCGKNVIPNQKYCERHMHRGRGRHRSRKLVEASNIARPLIALPLNSSKPSKKPKTILSSVSSLLVTHNRIADCEKTRAAVPSQPAFAVKTASCFPAMPIRTIRANTTTTVPYVLTPIFTPGIVPASSNICATSTTTIVNPNMNNTNSKIDAKGIHQTGKSKCDIKIRFSRSPGLDISPKSVVLQAQGCKSCVNVTIDCEPGRCRRTDGKKWRCRRDVVPTQKYCPKHMHRGAKRRVADSKPETAPSADTKAVPNEAPNTNLSISIPVNPQPKGNDEKSSNSSGTDTTISDTNYGSSLS